MLRETDSVILMTQTNGEGEIVIATDEGKFKRVIASQIELSKRYRKGSVIVGMREGASVLSASYVREPYMLAVVKTDDTISELSTEDTFLCGQSSRAMMVSGYKLNSVARVVAMPHKKAD
jgi:DNA gyrase/topoisomerase IV subunit A